MNLQQLYIDYIKKNNLFQATDNLLIAVSGGVDSIVLGHLCKEAGFQFSIAHCNFNLRGEESNRDEEFTRSVAIQLAVPILVKHFDTKQYANDKKISIQVAARELRYEWFYEIINESAPNSHHPKFNYILTAHHLDDNIETVMMNFFKGTGISGLRGIEPKHGKIVRPLLFASKKEIIDYANGNGLQWVNDSSNDETKYTRNFFRHDIIPAIEKVYPDVKKNLAANIQRATDAEMLYNQAITAHKKRLLECRGNEVHIPVLKLAKVVPLNSVVYETIKDFGFSSNSVEEVLKLLSSVSGKYMVSATHRILRNRAWLIISPISKEVQSIILIEDGTEKVSFGNKLLTVKYSANKQLPDDKNIALLDAKEIKFPLLLRRWKQGDYFSPLGMNKKKKLARFFIDEKLSMNDKENVWVIESGKKILWIVGHRIDDRFKLTGNTKKTLRLSVQEITNSNTALPK